MGATPCRFESCPGHDGQLPDADVRRALARRAAPVSRARGADDARRVAGGGRPAPERREGQLFYWMRPYTVFHPPNLVPVLFRTGWILAGPRIPALPL